MDINKLIINREVDIENQFNKIAHYLLNECSIVVRDYTHTNNYELDINEIEFYFNDKYEKEPPPIHQDIFTHCNQQQTKLGKWYFHRNKYGNLITAEKRRGMDLTFGNGISFGGILLRGFSIKNTLHIHGSGNTVRQLFGLLALKYDKDFIKDYEYIDINNRDALLYLEKKNIKDSKAIYSSPRVGLDKKKWQDGFQYLFKNYRYQTYTDIRDRNHQRETFIIRLNKSYGMDENKIKNNLSEISLTTIQKCLKEFDDGCNNPTKIDYINDSISKLYGVWAAKYPAEILKKM